MSVDYTAGVFFGACFPARSELGRVLDRYIDAQGGTPAPCGVPGLEIVLVGSAPMGDLWIVVRAEGSGASFGRGDEVEPPLALVEASSWRPLIESFLEKIGEKIGSPSQRIGWHFAGSAS